jgi:hypothetical protein
MESFQNPPGSIWSKDEVPEATSLRLLLSVSFGVGEHVPTEDFQRRDSGVYERRLREIRQY